MAPADFQPVVKKSVCYIVAAVLFNEKNEVSFRWDFVNDCQRYGRYVKAGGRVNMKMKAQKHSESVGVG